MTVVGSNVLMLVTDNQSADSLGCYGNTEHETPCIDRLAREGMLFTRAFCTNGTCSPTRASILTGLMPSQHGVHLAIPDDPPVPKADDYDVTREFRTLPVTLRNRGWQTALLGKWHLGNPYCRGAGWEHWVVLERGHTTDFHDNLVVRDGARTRVRGSHIVDWITDRAVEFIENRDTSRPFLCQVNWDAPYVLPPTVVGSDERNRHYERFRNRTFAPFPRIDDSIVRTLVRPFDFDLDPDEEYTLESFVNNVWWALRCHNDQETRANIAAQNALVDENVGRLLAALDSCGLAEETLVVLTTDQGNPYGQKGLWGHPPWTHPPFMFDVTFRVPLIVRRPGAVPQNRIVDHMVSHYDLFPTILGHLGVEDVVIDGSPGRDFSPLLGGRPLPGWEEEVFFEVETARTIRTSAHRYTRQLEGTGDDELFDLVRDPDQDMNVAGRPEYADVENELLAKLERFWSLHSDPRYDLWNGGSAQCLVSRLVELMARYGDGWAPTMEVGAAFEE